MRTETTAPEGTGRAAAGWWPLVAIALAVFMLMLDATVVTVALPELGRDLHAGLDGLQWAMNAYTLAMAAFQLTAGSIADRLGRRRTFFAGVTAFAVSSLACGLATALPFLIAARAAQGLAGALMFATTLALIAQCYDGRDRGIALGVRGTVAGLAVVLGPVAGGALVSGLGWRWIFLINLPVAALTLAVAHRTLPRGEHLEARRFDLGGPLLLAVTLVLLVLALLRGADDVRLYAGSAAGAAVFLLLQRRRREPMLDLSLFRSRVFTGTQVGSFAVQASVFALLIYLSVYFQEHEHYSALRTGLAFLPLVVPILLAGPVAGAVMDRMPKGALVAGALALLATGIALMDAHLIAGLAVAGFACGVALPVLGGLAVDIPDERHLGMASGVNNTVLQVGMSVGIAVYGAVLGSGAPSHADLARLFPLGASIALAGAVLTAIMLRGGSR